LEGDAVPVNEQVRKEAIAKSLDALVADRETHRVRWRDKMERLPVIRIALDSVVLNPRSHRIKSQLESNPEVRKLIDTDPDGEAAQESIARLLRATPGFEDLKQNLEDEPQREPGIVTREGRLINANTRAVALRDLGNDYIEVAVLPSDAALGEIYDLELDLQVAEDYKQDYTFTNELLFVEDLITDQGRNEEEVAQRLRWATPTKPSSMKSGIEKVRRYVRHLDLIREIQAMSGGRVPLTDFDDAEQTLQEFDKAYESLRDKDPVGAERLKGARTLGLLVDLGYSRQRNVNPQWVEAYLAEAFEEHSVLRGVADAVAEESLPLTSADPDGLEAFEDPGQNGGGEAVVHRVVSLLTERLSESSRAEQVRLPTPSGEKEFDRESIREAVNDAMRVAVEDSKRADRAGDDLHRPTHFVEEASKQLSKARQAYETVADRDEFDHDAFRQQIQKATRALDAVKLTVNP
jgi:ribosomal protein L13E